MIDSYGRPLTIDGTFPAGRLACASVIDTAIASEDTKSFFAAFDANRFWGGPWGSEVASMTTDTRMLRLVRLILFSRTDPLSVARDKWFAEYGADFARWLNAIKATETAKYVQELLDLYPNGKPFEVEVERGRHLAEIGKANPQVWRELRARYPSLEDELAARLRPVLVDRGTAIGVECDALRNKFAEPMPKTLSEIVNASSTDAEFVAALSGWLDAPKGRPKLGFERQPEVGQMLWVLGALFTSVSISGIVHFLLSQGVGAFFSKLPTWARKIGAATTAAYATATSDELRRLAGAKLPPMADAKRIDAIRDLEEQDEASGGRGLFVALDEQYGVLVTADLPGKLRAYVREHLEDIEGELFGALQAQR